MNATTKTAGFYGTDSETYYLTPAGKAWIVASEDDLGTDGAVAIESIPEEATPVDSLLTPEECLEYCERVQVAGGETLIGGPI